MRQSVLRGFALACLVVSCFGAAAQDYPTRRIRIVVGFPPGSQTDILARVVADQFLQMWNQPAIVENIAGAGGNIGTSTVFRSEPDGYTLLVVPPTFVINPFVYKNPGFTAEGWKGVSLIATTPYLLAARTGFPGNSVQELLQLAREKPGTITYGSGGVGSSAQLSALLLETLGGVKLVHVPYRGAAPALADVMANQVDLVFDAMSTTFPLFQNGSVKVLGIGSRSRASTMPQVPTIAESGLPEFESTTWTAVVAPPRTPDFILAKLSDAIRAGIRKPDNATRLKAMSLDVAGTTPAETDAFLAREASRWGKIARIAGVSLE